jgi:hypothetical protein
VNEGPFAPLGDRLVVQPVLCGKLFERSLRSLYRSADGLIPPHFGTEHLVPRITNARTESLIRTLPALQHDPNRPEDVDTEGDAARCPKKKDAHRGRMICFTVLPPAFVIKGTGILDKPAIFAGYYDVARSRHFAQLGRISVPSPTL